MKVLKATYRGLSFDMDVIEITKKANEDYFSALYDRAYNKADRDLLTGAKLCRRRGNKISVTIRGKFMLFTLVKR